MVQRAVSVERVRQDAGCTRFCAMSQECDPLRRAQRFVHNGVSSSHMTRIDHHALVTLETADVEHVLTLWCMAHHAGRDGREIPFQIDGRAMTVLVEDGADG